MPKCPGQDKLFWTADDVYEVSCPACGEMVEFFKTDPTRRCPNCAYVFVNPRLDPGCAEWCPHAELCVGLKLTRESAEGEAGEGAVRLVDRLVKATRDALGPERRQRIVSALGVLQRAQGLLPTETGDPRVVLPAAVFRGLGGSNGHEAPLELDVAQIMRSVGFGEEQVAGTLQVLEALEGRGAGGPEADLVADAQHLAGLQSAHRGTLTEDDLERIVEADFRTATGKARARAALQPRVAVGT